VASGVAVAAAGPRPAGLWLRILAVTLDAAGLSALWLVALGLGVPAGALPGPPAAAVLAGAGLALAAFECSPWRGSPGKRALGLVVADEAGHRIGVPRALARQLAKLASAAPLGLGFLLAAFGARHRALHDHLAGTHVEREPRPPLFFLSAGVAAVLAGAAAVALGVALLTHPLSPVKR
jgi:uncharacterized RDD family membrane protein YckC